jgi:trk system potassium uptake protein TrkH
MKTPSGRQGVRARARRARAWTLGRHVGAIWSVAALAVCAVAAMAFVLGEGALAPWLAAPAVGFGALAGALWRAGVERGEGAISWADAAAIVVAGWVGAIVMTTAAVMMVTDLTVTQALFESASGWTTTGLSVVDVTAAPRAVLLLRSVTEFVGGAGLAIAMITVVGEASAHLSSAEGRSDRLVPNARASAEVVLRLYAGYVSIGVLAYIMAGMGWFDAVNHAMAAVSTGGFSTHPDSIGHYDSALIEAITIALMLAGTTSFLVAYEVLVKGRWSELWRSPGARLMWVAIGLSAGMVWLCDVGALYGFGAKSARVAVFEVVSAISTTGFSTVGYAGWGDASWLVMIGLMIIGGGANSTAGGLKQARVWALGAAAWARVRGALLGGRAVVEPRAGSDRGARLLDASSVQAAATFALIYFAVLGVGVLVMCAHGVPMADALFESASTLSTVGLSVGVTSPDAPTLVLLTQSLMMLCGRLEFFALVVGAFRLFGLASRLRDGSS